MEPLRMRIERIADFGVVVSLIGTDTETAEPVTVHVDHRPFAAFLTAWCAAGWPIPTEYVADRLLLHLTMIPTDEAPSEIQGLELSTGSTGPSTGEREAVQGLGR
jgi:hypothetical protein